MATNQVKLIYRAYVFNYVPRPLANNIKLRALNWRFHSPSKKIECTPRPLANYVKPQVMNWRFQLAANPNQVFPHSNN